VALQVDDRLRSKSVVSNLESHSRDQYQVMMRALYGAMVSLESRVAEAVACVGGSQSWALLTYCLHGCLPRRYRQLATNQPKLTVKVKVRATVAEVGVVAARAMH